GGAGRVPGRPDLPRLAPRLCPLRARLETRFEGEIVGVNGSGLFVRFDDVFEAFLPDRRLPGDYFEVSPLGTALAGRRGGRTYRLGDPIEIRVERIERASGRVEVAPV